MALTREEVLKVAKLARLEFNNDEIEKYQTELNEILNYIDMLNELDTENTKPLSQVNNDTNNLREDEVKPSLSVKEALKNAPEEIDGTVVVPKVVGGE
ncbi:Asp-tRNA(Asn)/Glu-tRNA(Gln) amidotransferase subunit GatC [Fusobacterium perfoetens]|uniref:Asp-tRNA(Asn)/Glu-tRNA(Gln) amidotransferase subunit GatC n=1 Tax=Fusobacterium perfoetens TaxID=852 RepID=UPI0004861570|nr:Asp-tRNA(Asn)/Glu-tRNA(Gln) amidotransferase subunit GatC [Fusobacterium perfoetens]MCI6153260.1 Asp-tRNA(Asn)/Glu-tRNA(Gln) amidotransferase subunit GatC [Fusobacterium perfoetens]MDY3238361.1 Asp-tRNA(Asn)/Glu-tRNA(Gln) amidotransferase subunit GatC [Fusobacterium perfoetens]